MSWIEERGDRARGALQQLGIALMERSYGILIRLVTANNFAGPLSQSSRFVSQEIDVPFLRLQYFAKQVATDVGLVRLAIVPGTDIEALLGQRRWIPLFFTL